MDTIVALDIETTGLDPEKEAVLEIGLVRFQGHRVDAEWASLINPGRKIPPFITQLTGINDQMVLKSPSIREVIPDLAEIVGNSPILGHNVRFDLSFLRRYGILKNNTVLDTYDLAAVLLPTSSRYGLGSLTQSLGVLLPATHRALADAHATRGVYLRLVEEALAMPLPILAELVRLGEMVDWAGYWPFRLALRTRSKEIVSPQTVSLSYTGPLFEKTTRRTIASLQPVEKPTSLDTDEVSAVLEPGGSFAHYFHDFEYRPQQAQMLRSVTEAFSLGQHLLVEAGTGTGKSIAYLIPAALWAIRNNSRVVISTNTINLQDQLIKKDIPDLCQALGIDLRATVLKGRSNYLCPRRFESLRHHGPENADEMRVLGKVLVWLQATETGDRSEINLNSPAERQVWMRISSEDEGCTTETCLKRTGGACPFYRIRQEALGAHILVINHALLLADVATGNRVLPDYQYLIIDEAHHLEDATTNALSYHITLMDIERTMKMLGSPNSGVLGWVLSATQGVLASNEFATLSYLIQRINDTAFRFENLARQFFITIETFLSGQRDGRPVNQYVHQERIVTGTRSQPAWCVVELAWDDLQLALTPLLDMLNQLAKGLAEIQEVIAEEDEELYGSLVNLIRRLSEFNDNVDALVFKPAENQIYWAETQSANFKPSLHTAPLHIGSLMQRYLWQEKTSIILTSATLTAAESFEYIKGRLSAEDAEEILLGSPFDYEQAALLYLANDIPEPGDRNGHQRAVETGLINLCRATGGRTLALFTSYDQLKRTSRAISHILSKYDIMVYEQGEGASPHSLLEAFRSNERAVLLGTRAFWEGVDVPGEALSVLVIVKLPFDVPSEPIIAARSETFEDPFYQYSLPEAILRFRQGFGRLIRTQSDRGIVVVLDRRIISKRYGKLFLDSLPGCNVKAGPLSELPATAVRWLNL